MMTASDQPSANSSNSARNQTDQRRNIAEPRKIQDSTITTSMASRKCTAAPKVVRSG